MIIPSSSFASFSSVKKPVAGGGGSDVTPNAVNWGTISYDNDTAEYTYAEQCFTGINQTITLKVQYTSPGSTVYYYVSNTEGDISTIDPSSPSTNGMTPIANNGTFTVSNDQCVTFGATPACSAFATVTVLNQSDGDVILDTILMSYFGEC